ncbi:MAG: hypothetical protein ACJ789_10215 [Thermomicrobiales bacterium]
MRSPAYLAARICLAIALLVALFVGRPAAGQELHHAGLIVRHGDGRITYAYIAFPEETINGIELLKRSGIPLVTVSFGGLGEGVCSLDSEGCPASDCRQRVCQGPSDASPYWRYFRQSTAGDWQALALGASSTNVHDGDIDGWSWTPDNANLPAVTMNDLRSVLGIAQTAAASSVQPTAFVKTVLPAGVSAESDDGQSLAVYFGAAVILAAICIVAAIVIGRGRLVGIPPK